MSTQRTIPDYWTKADLEWQEREDQGIKPNPIPDCRAYCVACGEVVVDASGAVALHVKCSQILSSKLPALYRRIHRASFRGLCGHNLVDPNERWDA